MKKSQIYKLAQYAVADFPMDRAAKMEVLRELIALEDFARIFEEVQEKEKSDEAV